MTRTAPHAGPRKSWGEGGRGGHLQQISPSVCVAWMPGLEKGPKLSTARGLAQRLFQG